MPAHTPLLSSLVDFFTEHFEAAERRIPVEAVREEQATRGLTRRDLLRAGAASAVGALALPRMAWGREQPRVAIIGAGISGLSAALTLKDLGYASTIYEASSRIGGRMFSNMDGYWDGGQTTEWLGELIDSPHVTIRGLVNRFGLDLVNALRWQPEGSEDTFFFLGRHWSKEEFDGEFAKIREQLETDQRTLGDTSRFDRLSPTAKALDSLSVYNWVNTRVPGGHSSPLGRLIDTAYRIEYGGDTIDQSALDLLNLIKVNQQQRTFRIFGASNERYRIAGGNQRLPLTIAKFLGPDAIRFNMRMAAVARNQDGTVTITFDGGKTVKADFAILSLPFAVLSGLDTSKAGFDPLKVRAIRELGRGWNSKLQLQFTRRHWNGPGKWGKSATGSSFADTYQCTWEATRGQRGASGILNNYTGGKMAAEFDTKVPFADSSVGTVERDARELLKKYEEAFPGITPFWNGKATLSQPQRDPNLNLAYSYYRRGQWQGFSGYERVRQGNVLFAGEHTSTEFQGFMEGGAAEGIRAAHEVLATIGKPTNYNPASQGMVSTVPR